MNWEPITGYEGIYEISATGIVRRVRTGRVLKSSRNSRGYQTIHLSKEGVESAHSIHVLVATAFKGPKPDGLHVNHIDGDKGNNSEANLEWVTQAQNMQHAHRTGLMRLPNGERQWKAKLTIQQVKEIRDLCAQGVVQRVIGQRYGICQAAVSDIKCGRNWK